MPTKYFILPETAKDELGIDSNLYFDPFIKIKPTDDQGNFTKSIEGKYRSSGIVIFPNAEIQALTALFSIEVHANYYKDDEDINLGNIKLQISNNNGTSYLYWNGSNWVTALGTNWNTINDIQNHIDTFPFSSITKQIKIKAQLNPDSDFDYTPELIGIAIHYELEFIPEEDVIRSLFNKINNELEIITETAYILSTSKDSFVSSLECEIEEVIGVWNLTLDPARLNNIYQSITKELIRETETGEKYYKQTIVMNTSPAANSSVLARVKVKIPVFIAPDSDYVFSDLPQIIVEIGNHAEDYSCRDSGNKVEKNKAKLKARIRKQPVYYRMPITILSASPDDLFAIQINRALVRLLKRKYIISLASAEKLFILDETDFASSNDVREGLSIKQFSFTIRYKDMDTSYEEVELVQSYNLITDLGGMK
jgi:hypothetical protein